MSVSSITSELKSRLYNPRKKIPNSQVVRGLEGLVMVDKAACLVLKVSHRKNPGNQPYASRYETQMMKSSDPAPVRS